MIIESKNKEIYKSFSNLELNYISEKFHKENGAFYVGEIKSKYIAVLICYESSSSYEVFMGHGDREGMMECQDIFFVLESRNKISIFDLISELKWKVDVEKVLTWEQ